MGQTVRAEFARWLRDQLASQGWLVSDFAERVGVRPSAVYRWTAGQRAPTDSQVDKIAAVLKVPTDTVWAALARSGVAPTPVPAQPVARRREPAKPAAPGGGPGDHRFAAWLRDRLAERGWTTGFLARKLDLDPVTVRAWTTGVRQPASVQFSRIAEALGTSPEAVRDLIEG